MSVELLLFRLLLEELLQKIGKDDEEQKLDSYVTPPIDGNDININQSVNISRFKHM